MKSKTTLILLVITAAVFAYMFFYERKAPTTEEAKRQAQNVVNFSREKIDGIVIQNGDDKIDLRRRDKKWRLETSKETFLAAQSIKKEIEKKATEFRDRKLTDLITAQVSRVVLKTAAGEMELQKKGDHWEIVKPLRARGDDQKIADLIAQMT